MSTIISEIISTREYLRVFYTKTLIREKRVGDININKCLFWIECKSIFLIFYGSVYIFVLTLSSAGKQVHTRILTYLCVNENKSDHCS